MINAEKSLLKTVIKKRDAIAFLAMAFVCGVFSSSTPDNVTLAEIFIGLILVILVGPRGFFLIFDSWSSALSKRAVGTAYVSKTVLLSMIYLILVPSITGLVFSANELMDYVRDIIPLLYLFIPVLLLHRFRLAPSNWLIVLLLSLCLIGISYSLRHFTTTGEADISQIGSEFIWGGNMDNISQDPAVIYMMAYLVAFGIAELFCGKIHFGVIAVGLAIFPWAANIASVTRASIGLAFATSLITVFYLLAAKKMRNSLVVLCSMMLLPIILLLYGDSFYLFIVNSFALLVEKNMAVGLSARDLEANVVLNNVDSIGQFIFGTGWGGVFANPISGGGLTRYVHNSFIFFYLKGGILGLLCFIFYLGWFLRMLISIYKDLSSYREFVIFVSLLPPLLISLLLEPMYKSLSIGLVLSIIPLLLLARSRRDTVAERSKLS